MRGFWPCWSCSFLLLSAILGATASAEPMATPTLVSKRPAMADKLAKAQVTTFPFPHKRDSVCQASYTACAASLSGGCCQNGYECHTDSCYLTQVTASACGQAGYFACDLQAGGELFRDDIGHGAWDKG